MFGITVASTTDLFAQAYDIVQGSWPLLIVAIGVPLGFYIVRKLIGLMPKR